MAKGLIVTILSVLFFTIPSMSQTMVWHQGIVKDGINVRGNPVVVGQISIDAPSSGKVEVRFDGQCIADVGDRIILAASDTTDWGINDGSVDVVGTSSLKSFPFSHTREYSVTAGTHNFYAVAQNYVDENGSGIASIYASLTVKFFPDSSDAAMLMSQGISQTNINVRGNPVVVSQINFTPPAPGKVIVHFDGQCIADNGDRIILAASDTSDWGINDGSVDVLGTSDIHGGSFSHTRDYDVSSGSYTFYAVAENYVDVGGSGIASIYANLTVEFFAFTPSGPFVQNIGISKTNINVRGNPVTVGNITIAPTVAGKVLVHFDGQCIADIGDRIVLAASNSPNWGINDGSVDVIGNNDIHSESYSHTEEYDIPAGSTDLYAVAQNYVDVGGSGIASIYASLTAEFFPTVVTSVQNSKIQPNKFLLEQNYPNPFNPTTKIKYEIPKSAYVTINVYNVLGNKVATLVNNAKPAGNYEVEFNASSLSSGIYFYKIQAGAFSSVKKMILLK